MGIVLQHFEAPHPLSNVHHVVLCGSCGCENNARTLRNYGKPAVIEQYLQLSRNKYIPIVGHVLCSADNSWEIDHILGSSAFKQRPTCHEVICCLLYSMFIMSYKYGNSVFLIKVVECEFIFKLIRLFHFYTTRTKVVLEFTSFLSLFGYTDFETTASICDVNTSSYEWLSTKLINPLNSETCTLINTFCLISVLLQRHLNTDISSRLLR